MELRIQNGSEAALGLRRSRLVMAIILILAIAVPLYQKSLQRTKETLLKNNLFMLRTVIDEYTFDKEKAPQTLQDLVNEGYLRKVPDDPTLRTVIDEYTFDKEQAPQTLQDPVNEGYVRSGSNRIGLDGTL